MTRILVTGASGWIGGYVLDEIEARGMTAIGTSDRESTRRPIYFLDVTDGDSVTDALRTLRPDAVINLAGRLGTEELHGSERLASRVNILGALNVATACARTGIRIVQIGTGHKGQPNVYAITKACAEDLILSRARNLGDNAVIVRAFHAYGPGQAIPPPHGAAHVRKIIPSFVCRALTAMPLEIYGDGKNLIDLVYVQDVARVLVDAALDAPAGATLEAGAGRELAVADVADMVIEACHSPSRVRFQPPRPGEPVGARAVADHPLCDNRWPYMLDETIDWYASALGLKR